jgi:hypothetical protein
VPKTARPCRTCGPLADALGASLGLNEALLAFADRGQCPGGRTLRAYRERVAALARRAEAAVGRGEVEGKQ